MSFQTGENGRAQDTPGDQGWKEAEGQGHLQLKTCPTDGGVEREKRSYIVHIENASDFKSAFVVEKVSTVNELIQAICDRHPALCHHSILMQVSDSRAGTMHRVFYKNELPSEKDTLYVKLVLRKHTP
jgi:hypothetical protein